MTLLQEIQEMDPREIANRPEVKALWNKGLFWLLANRRSHRNALGVEAVKDGFFDYKKVKEPVPLTAVELALLCWAGMGTSGLHLGDGTVFVGARCEGFEGTTNTAQGFRYGHLFFNNDDGLFLYRRHVPTKLREIESQGDMEVIFRAFKEGVIQLSGENIIKDSSASPAIMGTNRLFTFKPGTTQFFPMMDTTVRFLMLLHRAIMSDNPEDRIILIDDATGKPAGIQKWVDNGYLKGHPVPLSLWEISLAASSCTQVLSSMQLLQLCAAAMGLGAFPHFIIQQFMMGGTPVIRGLDFRWASDKRGHPYPVGKDGLCEGHLPPYMSIDEAVDDFFSIPFGPRGTYTSAVKEGDRVVYTGFSPEPRAVHRPYKDPDKWLQAAREHFPTPEEKQVLKDIANYVYNTYGRIPVQVDPFLCPYITQIHHIDPEFYEEYWPEGAVTEEEREHLRIWHGINE